MTCEELIQEVFRHLCAEGEWPSYELIERRLWRTTPLQRIVREDRNEHLRPLGGRPSRLGLTLAGIARADGSALAIERFLAFARELGRRELERSQPGEAFVTGEDLQSLLQLSDLELNALYYIIDSAPKYHLTSGSGRGSKPQDFRFDAGEKAYVFSGVRTLQEYQRALDEAAELARLQSEPMTFGWLSTERDQVQPEVVGPQALNLDTWQLHPAVVRASARLFNAGIYAEAVRASLQAFEAFVQRVAGSTETGSKLMGMAFADEEPLAPLNALSGRHERGEHTGFRFLAMGAMLAIRNLYSHGEPVSLAPSEAVEQLALASHLFRRLEKATGIRAVVTSGDESERDLA